MAEITRFHCIYWPAFLMAVGIPPPRQVLTHAHWTLGRKKMAKSTGNVVNPFYALDRFGVDTIRYYLIHDGGIRDDANYDNTFIVEKYKKGLYGSLGNLASRVLRGKQWNVRNAVEQETNGVRISVGSDAAKHREVLSELPGRIKGSFVDLDPGAALKQIMDVIYKVCNSAAARLSLTKLTQTNAYMQAAQPWAINAKIEEPETDVRGSVTPIQNVYWNPENINEIIYTCTESLRVCGILLQPFMPQKMKTLLDMLGVSSEARSYDNSMVGSDRDYGVPSVDLGKGTKGALFPPLTSEL